MPGPQVCVGGCLRVVARGMAVGARFRRASGTPPLRFAREWAVTEACPSSGPAGPPSPKGEGKGCCWRQRKPSRGVGDAAPCGLPGNGRQRESPRVVTRGRTSAQASAGRRGRRPLRFAREWAAAGACPSSGPAGPPSPKGEGKGCCWRQREPALPTPAAGPRCGAGGSGCSTSGLTKPAQYRRNPGRCRGGSRR